MFRSEKRIVFNDVVGVEVTLNSGGDAFEEDIGLVTGDRFVGGREAIPGEGDSGPEQLNHDIIIELSLPPNRKYNMEG